MHPAPIQSAVERQQMIDVLVGRHREADVVFQGGQIVNVMTRELQRADLAVLGQKILMFGDATPYIGPKTEVVDVRGCYLAPGFMDSHMHFESSMLTVTEFSRLSLPTGTTTLIADPHEIGNALGPVGMKAMIDEGGKLPHNVYWVLPSLTPDSPGLETAGVDITSKDMPEMLNYPGVLGIGELQGFSNVQNVYENNPNLLADLLASTTYARALGKVVDGNAPDLFEGDLAAHILCGGGTVSCHETTRKDEALEKLRQGVYLFMRDGSTQRNMPECIRALTEEHVDSRRMILVTDDMVAEDLEKLGHMDEAVRRAIREGVDPVEAIQMVTLNPATYFGLDHVGALLPGRQADVVVLNNLENMQVREVWVKGKRVARDRQLEIELPRYTYPDVVKNSVQRRPVTARDLAVTSNAATARARAVGLIPDQNLTTQEVFTLRVENGIVVPDATQDVAGLCVLERYGQGGGVGKAFLHGLDLKCGAIAESVSHDAHNLIVAGTSWEEMALAANRVISLGGGIAVVKGDRVIGDLRLPVGGLISDELDGVALAGRLTELHALVKEELGSNLHSPFMHLSFLALTTSPTWKITDKGLIDVNSYSILDPLEG